MQLTPLSKSTYSVFLKCPFKAHAHKNLGHKSIAGPAAELGSAVHLVWENWLNTGKDPEQCDQEILDLFESAKRMSAEYLPFRDSFVTEQELLFSSEMAVVDSAQQAAFRGFADLMFVDHAGRVHVVDLKTGRSPDDDPFERDIYAMGAALLHPESSAIIFTRLWVRKNVSHSWQYYFNDGSVTISSYQSDDVDILSGSKNPRQLLFDRLMSAVKEIEATEPTPTPGRHCENWYGQPCQFLGNICPLNSLPVLDQPVTVQDIMLAISRGETPVVTSETAAQLMAGSIQLQGFLKRIDAYLAQYSHDNGDITLGDAVYGWRETEKIKIDNVAALTEFVRAGIPIETVAKAVNISPTSIKKLPKQWDQIKNYILSFSVSSVERKTKFGPVK
jgi:hypothetical protein